MKEQTRGQILIEESLVLLNAIRSNKEVERKQNIDFYKLARKFNPSLTPVEELSDKAKLKFEWHPSYEEFYTNLELSVGLSYNLKPTFYRVTENTVDYKCSKDIDATISALVDLYNGKKVLRRKNFKMDKEMQKISLEKAMNNLTTETDPLKIRSLEWSIRDYEKGLDLPEQDIRYNWYYFQRDALDKNSNLNLALFDLKPSDDYEYGIKETLEKIKGVIL